jgi:hypothetical protein
LLAKNDKPFRKTCEIGNEVYKTHA